MIPEMGSLTQKASDARPHHWGEPTAQASLSGGQIAQATGLARATVKRLIRGDRRHKAKLAGLGWVRWDDGIKNRTPASGRGRTLTKGVMFPCLPRQ